MLFLDLCEDAVDGLGVLHHFRFGDLDLDARGIDARLVEDAFDQYRQAVLSKLLDREIDTDSERANPGN